MPHVTVRVAAGKSEQQKRTLVELIVKDLMSALNSEGGAISVGIEEVSKEDWTDKVYLPEIQSKWNSLYKKPGYGPLAK